MPASAEMLGVSDFSPSRHSRQSVGVARAAPEAVETYRRAIAAADAELDSRRRMTARTASHYPAERWGRTEAERRYQESETAWRRAREAALEVLEASATPPEAGNAYPQGADAVGEWDEYLHARDETEGAG